MNSASEQTWFSERYGVQVEYQAENPGCAESLGPLENYTFIFSVLLSIFSFDLFENVL